MSRINDLQEQANRLQADIDIITNAFGAEYVPDELTNALKSVMTSIDFETARIDAVKKCEQNGRAILAGASLAEDGGQFRHKNHDALKTSVANYGMIRWSCVSQNDGQICEIRVIVQVSHAADAKCIIKKMFTIDWQTKSVKLENGKLDVIGWIQKELSAPVIDFRRAEFCATYDAIKKSINAAGIRQLV